MLTITLLVVGKIKDAWLRQGIGEFEKRMGGLCQFQVIEVGEARLPLKPKEKEIQQALEKEGEALLEKIPLRAKVIPLCIEGKSISSTELGIKLDNFSLESSQVVFIIGGSHGLDSRVKERGDFKLSLSPMTFTHQLTRLLLAEQIYRALSIGKGSPYHK